VRQPTTEIEARLLHQHGHQVISDDIPGTADELAEQAFRVRAHEVERSEEEILVLAVVRQSKGRSLTPQEEHLALEQARAIGDL